jgi:hypothetical protein
VSVQLLSDADAVIVALILPDTRPPVDYWRRPLVEFRLLVGATIIRADSSGRALSQYAFANGANRVVHSYDLGLEPPSVRRVREEP